jgi:hypothetical protein
MRDLPIPGYQISPEKRWLVLNLTPFHPQCEGMEKVDRIPESYRPTYLHDDQEAAEKELLRLAAYSGHQFLLFETVAYTDSVKVPFIDMPAFHNVVHRLQEMPTERRPTPLAKFKAKRR